MGYAPIPPVGKDFDVAMARTNDAILYGGTVYLTVDYDDETALQNIVSQHSIHGFQRLWQTFLADFP